MVVKRFFISISMLFLGALLLQAKNIIARDMGANKGEVPANIAILDSDSNVVAKNMTGISDSTVISLSDVEVITHRKNIKLSGHKAAPSPSPASRKSSGTRRSPWETPE